MLLLLLGGVIPSILFKFSFNFSSLIVPVSSYDAFTANATFSAALAYLLSCAACLAFPNKPVFVIACMLIPAKINNKIIAVAITIFS